LADFEADGTHPSQDGESQVGSLLLEFFENSPHSASWFTNVADPGIPTAAIEATPEQGFSPLRVLFDGRSSADDGEIVSYFWDFGDSATSTATAPRHSYPNPGDYTATLTVTDNEGYSDTDSVAIRVFCPRRMPGPLSARCFY
jgi:PKD repeat protein